MDSLPRSRRPRLWQGDRHVSAVGRCAGGPRGPGLYWIIPLNIERSVRVDIRTRTVSAEQQETITRDSVTIKVNGVLWYRIVDAEKSVIEVADAPAAVYQLALTGLRNIIGQHDLDEVLQERNKINTLLRESIASSTAAWGLEVQRFEMKDVELPEAMQQVMAMQAEAIREKRARRSRRTRRHWNCAGCR